MSERQRWYNFPQVCEHCEHSFESSRYDARFCSDACRVAAHREKKAIHRKFEKLVKAYDEYSELLRARYVIPEAHIDHFARMRNSLNYFWDTYDRRTKERRAASDENRVETAE